jgi:hypothetical protein
MERKQLPSAYYWFSKLNNTRFVPWSIDGENDRYARLNELFSTEHNENRFVESFGSRQDMDTYCGFEVKNGTVKENIIVFHPSWQNGSQRNIIENEYSDIFDFMHKEVLPTMQNWIREDNIDRYLEK